jgi:hypothetical protein
MRARNTGREPSSGETVATTKGTSSMGNTKDEDSITSQTKGDSTKVSSWTIRCMDMGKKHGQMGESTKAITETPRKTGLAHSSGLMGTCTKANGETTNKMEKGSTLMWRKALKGKASGRRVRECSGQVK